MNLKQLNTLIDQLKQRKEETKKRKFLPSRLSAQEAGLTALIHVCKLAKGKAGNIYTDSRYAWICAWPKQVTVCHCAVHTNNCNPVLQQNTKVNAAANAVAKQQVQLNAALVFHNCDLQDLQQWATPNEKQLLKKRGFNVIDGVW